MVGDKKPKPILVGLSGGVHSMVAAYLLRIQKKELYGAIIAATPESLQDQGVALFSCHQEDSRLAAVKKFCDHLHIPLTVLRPREEFQDMVLDPWVAARVSGVRPRLCHDCHLFRMQMLARQARQMGCGSFVTGHFAKVFKHPDGSVTVHSSNDMEMDQSGLIAGLPHDLLSMLELPLSELQLKEVLKIAENFNLHLPPRVLAPGKCMASAAGATWLGGHVPETLRHKGELQDAHTTSRLGAHLGFYEYEVGQQVTVAQDKHLTVVGHVENHIVLDLEDCWKDRGVHLRECHWGEGEDTSTPLRGFVHHGGGVLDTEVLIFPKTLGGAYVEVVGDGQEPFVEGLHLVVFKRRGKNAKVLLQGVMGLVLREWPSSKIITPEDEEMDLDIDPATLPDKDFNF